MKVKELEEHPTFAAVLPPATSEEYDTTGWRAFKPVVDKEKCTGCLICWIYCPEPAIIRTPDRKIEFDYKHCKGCGICEVECPVKAIRMVKEA